MVGMRWLRGSCFWRCIFFGGYILIFYFQVLEWLCNKFILWQKCFQILLVWNILKLDTKIWRILFTMSISKPLEHSILAYFRSLKLVEKLIIEPSGSTCKFPPLPNISFFLENKSHTPSWMFVASSHHVITFCHL